MLGLGVGHPSVIEAGYGAAHGHPLNAMREYVGIIRRVLGGERVAARARSFEWKTSSSNPAPVIAPRRRRATHPGFQSRGVTAED